jgi:hypothetical protein
MLLENIRGSIVPHHQELGILTLIHVNVRKMIERDFVNETNNYDFFSDGQLIVS